MTDNIWSRHKITLEIGPAVKQNGNRRMREIKKEFLKSSPDTVELSTLDLVEVTKAINSRIMASSPASSETLLFRSPLTKQMSDLTSHNRSRGQREARPNKANLRLKHSVTAALKHNNNGIQVGDQMTDGNPGRKHQPRPHFVAHNVLADDDSPLIRGPQNIMHVLDESYTKPPWLLQDQPDETLGVKIQGYCNSIQAIEHEARAVEPEVSTVHQPVGERVENEPVTPPAMVVEQMEVLIPSEDPSQREITIAFGPIQTISQACNEKAPPTLERNNELTTTTFHDHEPAPALADLIAHATNTEQSPASPVISEHSEQRHPHAWANVSQNVVISEPGSLTATQLTSHIHDPANFRRSSARQQSKPKVDYRHLDSRGKPDKH